MPSFTRHARIIDSCAVQAFRLAAAAGRRGFLFAVVLVTLLAMPLAGTALAAAPAPKGATDAEKKSWNALHEQQAGQQLKFEAIQLKLFSAEDRYESAVTFRSSVLQRYGEQLVALYEAGDYAHVDIVMAARSIREMVDAISISQDIADYRASLSDDLERATKQAERGDRERRKHVDELRAVALDLDGVLRRKSDIEYNIEVRQEAAAAEKRRKQKAQDDAAQLASNTVQLPPSSQEYYQKLAQYATENLWSPDTTASGPTTATEIDLYLAQKGSPMTGSGALFMTSAMANGIDPRFLVAVSGAESNFGKTLCGTFNAWGWGCPSSAFQFDSWSDGIETVATGLRRFYIEEGRTSVVTIHQKYAPVGVAHDPLGLNSYWVKNVSKFLNEQGGNPGNVTFGQQQS